jgi:hypothetical protein
MITASPTCEENVIFWWCNPDQSWNIFMIPLYWNGCHIS